MALHVSIRKVTPPESIIVNGLSTPPSTNTKASVHVASILQVFKDCYAGLYPDYWTIYPLSGAEYEQVLDQLNRDECLSGFVEEKVRYDFDPIRGVLIFRIASIKHDTFALKLADKIKDGLKHLANTEIEARPFVQKIEQIAGRMFFPIDDDQQKHKIKHVPDIMFKHNDAMWAGIVIEVSYSQKKKDLPYLADNYILRSDGGIKVMVGIDLEYQKTKRASISIWQLKTFLNNHGELIGEVEQVVNDQFFQDAEGHYIPSSANLKLPLNYFAVEKVTQNIPDYSIVIDSYTLYTMLSKAEDVDNEMRTGQGVNGLPFKRKYRERTPPEQLTPSDEEKFVEDERRVRSRVEEQDLAYSPEGVEDNSE